MASPDGLKHGNMLLDFSTDPSGPVDIEDPGGTDAQWLYVTGVSGDTLTLEYRPNENRAWVSVISGLSNGVQTLQRRPEGQYRITRDANSDDATVAFL